MNINTGYTIMWMIVMFDLPVTTKIERHNATKFRNDLLDLGFLMHQFSVYIKRCACREKVDSVVKKIHYHLPKKGKVNIIWVTDKQFCDSILIWEGTPVEKPSEKQENLLLF